MTVAFIIFFLSYISFVLYLIWGWKKVMLQNNSEAGEHSLRCSIIIPVRNEEQTIQNLLDDIQHQSYKNFEVILVNDHSTDRTAELVRSHAVNDARITLFDNFGDGKKSALSLGIRESTGEVILTTDGDCRVGQRWLEGMVNSFQKKEIQFVFGSVKIDGDSFFSKLQSHEFLSLIGTAAASLAFQFPTMCNGANLAFRKSAFMKVGGYAGNLHIPSGDDEFLMRKIFSEYPKGISFANNPFTVVSTCPSKSLNEFFNQRIRWAGKWRHNQSLPTRLLAVFIFSFHLSIILLLMAALRGWVETPTVLILLILKAMFEGFFLRRVASFVDVKWNWLVFTLLQIVYPLYVAATAIISNVSSYEWKGRKLKSFSVSAVKK